jgi:hypothetical protein
MRKLTAQNDQNLVLKRIKSDSPPKKVEKINISKIRSIPTSSALKKARIEGHKLKVAKVKALKSSFIDESDGR